MSSQVLTWIKTNLNMLHRQYIFEIWVQNYYFFLIYANFFGKKMLGNYRITRLITRCDRIWV